MTTKVSFALGKETKKKKKQRTANKKYNAFGK